jgi:FkbM family methyltransferase
VGSSGQVLAIEPSPLVFPYLEQNIRLNKVRNVAALRLALSDRDDEEAPFYVPPSDHFGMGALAPQFHVSPCAVSAKTLDHVIAEQAVATVKVLKVDVEGHEVAVFRGGRGLLSGFAAPTVIFEFCDWAEQRFPGVSVGDAQRFLMSLGYQIWRLREYRVGARPLDAPITRGAEMLVAQRRGPNGRS